MEYEKEKTCCFIGHRNIENEQEIKEKLKDETDKLINKEKVCCFLFGSKSEFDDLCYDTVTKIKEKYHHIKRIYVRAEYPYINEEYRKHIMQRYEETYYPEKIKGAGKASYIERNYEMLNKSKYCIFYYDEKYVPGKGKKSGTKIAYEYAKRKGLCIINLKK